MNNIRKTALGLLVAILAIGFSAFTPNSKTSNYGKQITGPSTHNWIDLSGYTEVFDLVSPLNPGEYRCKEEEITCTGTFSSPPAANQPNPPVTVDGEFEYEPM